MKSKKKKCRWCSKPFVSHPRLKGRQHTCGAQECKRKQNLLNAKRWQKRNKQDYSQYQRDWRQDHPSYWKAYRNAHPTYTARNRAQAKIRQRLSKLGLQNKLDILQVDEKQTEYWNFARFAKLTRSLVPLLYAYSDPQPTTTTASF